MRFTLFLIANAMLFIRPSELIPELHAVEIYRWFILACLVVSFPVVLKQLSLRFDGVPPIVTCVVLLLPAVFVSGFFHGNFELIQDTIVEFGKVLIYFLLLISLVTDTAQLQRFLRWITLFSAAVTLIAVLRYHADIALPSPPKTAAEKKDPLHGTYVVDQVRDSQTGAMVSVQRMCGTGIFNDPNDFALLLVTAIPLCLCWLTDPAAKSMRPFWFLLFCLFGYALMLTHSRGGLLALMAGLGLLTHLRYGPKISMLLGAGCLPLVLVFFAGRMTTISTDEGTGQTRIQLWSDGLMFFQYSPLFGIGMENYRQFSSHVAHHSFIHSYAELGMIGGTLFLGAFYFAIRAMFALRNPSNDIETDAELRRIHPFLMGMLIAYAVGICFLSRGYIVPTYMVLGVTVVFLRLHATKSTVELPKWTLFGWPKLTGVSCCFLAVSFVFVRMFVKW